MKPAQEARRRNGINWYRLQLEIPEKSKDILEAEAKRLTIPVGTYARLVLQRALESSEKPVDAFK